MTRDDIGERLAALEAQMTPLLDVPMALARLEGKVDQLVSKNGNGRKGSAVIAIVIPVAVSAFMALLVVILTHALQK